jgi:hypothetical protein
MSERHPEVIIMPEVRGCGPIWEPTISRHEPLKQKLHQSSGACRAPIGRYRRPPSASASQSRTLRQPRPSSHSGSGSARFPTFKPASLRGFRRPRSGTSSPPQPPNQSRSGRPTPEGERHAGWDRCPDGRGESRAGQGERCCRWGKRSVRSGSGHAGWGVPLAREGKSVRRAGKRSCRPGKVSAGRGNSRTDRNGAPGRPYDRALARDGVLYTPGSGWASTGVAASGGASKARKSRTSGLRAWRSATRARPTPQPQ